MERVRQRKTARKTKDAVTGEVVAGEELVASAVEKLSSLQQSLAKESADGKAAKGAPPPETPRGRLLDLPALLLFVMGLCSRLYSLDTPRAIVFDELHYGKFVGFYMKKQFFFDSQPPLGKQLLSLVAYLAGFDGEFTFEKIGTVYPETMPIEAMRLLPAVLGSALLPATYLLLRELGISRRGAALAGFIMLLENALLTQSRFLLLEPFLLLFSVLGIFCVARFRRCASFSAAWFGWLAAGFAFLGAATTVRYSGFMTLLLGCVMVYQDFWSLVPRRDVSGRQLAAQLTVRGLVVLLVPLAVYLTSFYVHLNVLYRSGGGHDNVMTTAFQASLEDGIANIIKNQPVAVGHGSQITLRHSRGRPCWLHSHREHYPAEYDIERNSSREQQVSCFPAKDTNNWWIVKLPEISDLRMRAPFRPIKDGDIVQLVHGMTANHLNSHAIASGMSEKNQEVSCYTGVNETRPAEDLWKVQLVNPKETEGAWHAVTSEVRLVHVNYTMALKFSGRQLAEWGHSQYEVVLDTLLLQDDTVWNIEEHRYGQAEDTKDVTRQLEIIGSDLIPESALELSFWRKFYELQVKMLFNNQETVQGHTYASDPLEWLTLARGVAYWVSPSSNAQIHLLGNPAVWAAATSSLVLYAAMAGCYLLRRRRGCYDIPEDEWSRMCSVCQIILVGFLFNYLPYFVIDHTFFLHHYMPAYIFALMTIACMVDHLVFVTERVLKWGFLSRFLTLTVLVWLGVCVYTFDTFSSLSYGTTALTAEQLRNITWRESWGFIIHK